MWFKNLHPFRLLKPFDLSPEDLDRELAKAPFRPCGTLEMGTLGWVSPLGRGGQTLAHAVNGCLMVCLRGEDKILPAAVVREIVAEKVAAIEEEQMRKVGRKERESLREEVLHDLLPRAFTRSQYTYAYIDPVAGWLVVDSANRSRAENLTVLLRKCLGRLEIGAPGVTHSPAAVMTSWLREDALPGGWLAEDQCELREPAEQGGLVRLNRQDLGAEEVMAHLQAGKQVSKLALGWKERISFVLSDELLLRRLRFHDVVQEAAAQDAGEGDEAARFDADFAIMSLELRQMLADLLQAFGGEEQSVQQEPVGTTA